MSGMAKFVFGSACVCTGGVIAYVHLKQYIDRVYLHEGIVKDLERQQKKKTENLYNLQAQMDITKRYKESVSGREDWTTTPTSTSNNNSITSEINAHS